MVVAQIPLWMSHSTKPSSAAVSGISSMAKTNTASNTNKDTNNDSDNGNGNGDGNNNDKLLHRGKSQYHLWNPTTAASASIFASGKTGMSGGHEKRSAIYCCDVSHSRVATGGGDGKVKIWNLNSLFQTSKVDPSTATTADDDDADDNTDVSKTKNAITVTDTAKAAAAAATKKGMARFHNGGEYDSSDVSDCNSHSNNGKNIDSSDDDGDGDDNEQGKEETQQSEINDISSLVKRKKNTGNDTATATANDSLNGNKKRKRVELPQSTQTSKPSSSSSSKNKKKSTKSSTDQRLLCTISSHSGSVLTIRFSTSGTYLASAGDDSHILIYKQSKTPSILTTGNLLGGGGGSGIGGGDFYSNKSDSKSQQEEQPNIEHWNRIHILRGHNLDIVGLCWAPDDSHLISCSLDSDAPICVWKLCHLSNDDNENDNERGIRNGGNSNNTKSGNRMNNNMNGYTNIHNRQNHSNTNSMILHPYKVLGKHEHTSTVKGVAFDPAGKYIASSGDDPAICIWRAFDDWGLEARIDSTAGIFRSKRKSTNQNTHHDKEGTASGGMGLYEDEEEDIQALANLSLFRRISFAPDGTHVCGTNATIRGKNIAAMVSREGWGVSAPHQKKGGGGASGSAGASGGGVSGTTTSSGGVGSGHSAAGAANLVGHKQPVVSSRHCPYFFEVENNKKKKRNDDDNNQENVENDDEDAEPKYSTLVALGDKQGFVTIWSTKKSRPIFKLQCSESRCTVTDIAWGLISSGGKPQSLIMLVSLLDGFMVALRFNLPSEIGRILSEEKRHRIFRLKYGIELGSPGTGQTRRRLVDDKSGPKLIENVLQYAMEEDDDDEDKSSEDNDESLGLGDNEDNDVEDQSMGMDWSPAPSPFKQIESTSKSTGKRRIQPVLLTETGPQSTGNKSTNQRANGSSNKNSNKEKLKGGKLKNQGKSVSDVLQSAEKAASAAEGFSAKSATRKTTSSTNTKDDNSTQEYRSQLDSNVTMNTNHYNASTLSQRMQLTTFVIPPKLNQNIYTAELQAPKTASSVLEDHDQNLGSATDVAIVASCTNSIHTPPGMKKGLPCATLSISRGGERTWRDHLMGVRCTSIAASSSLLALGSYDGSIYLYGTSPSTGWDSGVGFRSHPPFVMSSSVVRLVLKETKPTQSNASPKVIMLVLSADGAFGVYSVMPILKLQYKGNILSPMNQMSLSSRNQSNRSNPDAPLPQLARILITESEHLLLVLSHSVNIEVSFGGMIQGFIYNRDLELWTRVSDCRFLHSNFYTSIPSSKLSNGLLSKIDQISRGCKNGQDSRRKGIMDTSTADMYYLNEDDEYTLQSFATRAHCEDRMACSLALKASSDFKHWFSLYVRRLCIESNSSQLRFIVDMLLWHKYSSDFDTEDQVSTCWWLSSTENVLGLNKKELVEKIIVPEMSKNRSLQRLMNEIATEVKSL